VAGYDAVAQVTLLVKAEIGCAMSHARVELDERIRVEQQIKSFASGELSAFMLLIDALFTAAEA